jgi:hypothetical protein
MTDDLWMPGLKRMKRHNGRVDLYWIADEEAVKAGFPTKTVRLHYDIADAADAAECGHRCQILRAEMREWMAAIEQGRNKGQEGTVGWLCKSFETDVDSPYRELRQATQVFYSRYMRALIETANDEHLSEITGRTVRRWHKEWLEKSGARSAYACVQTLRRIVSYGCEMRDRDCLELAEVLTRTEFKVPTRRKSRATHQMVSALRQAAHEAGRPSIARAVTLQFELGLRQKDVIGEWVRAGDGTREGIMDGAWRWEWGLTWSHIDSDMILRKPTSKSNGNEVAEHDLRHHPEILSELLSIPADARIGPVIIDEHSGKPWRPSTFSRTFRKIAKLAGWPDDVWNMDSRAGAVSEAFEAGADASDVMKAATHTQMSTTMGYNRGGIVQSGRVAELRYARRKSAEQAGNKSR